MSQTIKKQSFTSRIKEKFHLPSSAGDIKKWLQRLPDDPHGIALGVAIGSFISFTPLIPFHMVLAVSLAALFRGSKLTAVAATYISNPITIPLQYYAAYWTGSLVWRYPVKWKPHGLSLAEILNMGWEFALEMVTGGIINGLPAAILLYFITRAIYLRARKKKETS